MTVWSCISALVVGKLVKINATPTKEKYKLILQHMQFFVKIVSSEEGSFPSKIMIQNTFPK